MRNHIFLIFLFFSLGTTSSFGFQESNPPPPQMATDDEIPPGPGLPMPIDNKLPFLLITGIVTGFVFLKKKKSSAV